MQGNNMKRISVIVPVYKVEKYIKGSVQSVLKQSYGNVQIILVDDGSPDNCPTICDEFSETYSNIVVLHKKNGGLSSARNAGLDAISEIEEEFPEEEKTKYVVFLDSDDQLEKDAIAGMLRKAVDSKSDMVIPDRYTRVEESTGKMSVALHFTESMYENDPQKFAFNVLMKEGRAWRATALLYSYSVLQKKNIRFPEGHISEDISFNLQVLANIERIAIYPYSTLFCLKRSESITTSFQPNFEKDIWYIDEQAKTFRKIASENGSEPVDDLLCRNIVIYLISIMSMKNNTMNYEEKRKKSQALLNDKRSRKVVREKHHIPYFESRVKMAAIKGVYYLLRHNQDEIVYKILAKR